jgi:hypothetical protein
MGERSFAGIEAGPHAGSPRSHEERELFLSARKKLAMTAGGNPRRQPLEGASRVVETGRRYCEDPSQGGSESLRSLQPLVQKADPLWDPRQSGRALKTRKPGVGQGELAVDGAEQERSSLGDSAVLLFEAGDHHLCRLGRSGCADIGDEVSNRIIYFVSDTSDDGDAGVSNCARH